MQDSGEHESRPRRIAGMKNEKQRTLDSIRIVSLSADGKLELESDNLATFLTTLDSDELNQPFAFISILGPRRSGKSFYTNLLIQYLKHKGTGGWLNQITKPKNEVESDNGLHPGGSCETTAGPSSGIYLYPEPFQVENYKKKYTVLVLHAEYGTETNEEDNEYCLVDAMLNLICSRAVEIKWNNDEFRLLETRRLLSGPGSTQAIPIDAFCSSIVYMFRTNSEKPRLISFDDNSIDEASIRAAIHGSSTIIEQSTIAGLKHFGIIYMQEFEEPLNSQQQLKLNASMASRLTKTIKLIAEDSDILPINDEKLLGESLQDYLLVCINLINTNSAVLRKHFTKLVQSQDSDDTSPNSSGEEEKRHDSSITNIDQLRMGLAKLSLSAITTEVKNTIVDLESDPVLCSQQGTEGISNSTAETGLENNDLSQTKHIALKKERLNEKEYESQQAAVAPMSSNCGATFPASIHNTNEQPDGGHTITPGYVQTTDVPEHMDVDVDGPCADDKVSERKEDVNGQLESSHAQKDVSDDEKMQRILSQILPMSCNQVKVNMMTRLMNWIKTLNIKRLKNCGTIYQETFDEIIKDNIKVGGMTPFLVATLSDRLREKTTTEEASFNKIQSAVVAFHEKIDGRFHKHGYFEEENFDKIIQETVKFVRNQFQPSQNSNVEVSPGTYDYIKQICEKLTGIYREHNKLILQEENTTFRIAFDKIKTFYDCKMAAIIRHRLHSPQNLHTAHEVLIGICSDALPKTKLNDKYDYHGKMKHLLNKEYEKYKTENRDKCKYFKNQVSNQIISAKRKYDEDVDAELRKYPCGVEVKKLIGIHENTTQSAMKILETEIKLLNANIGCDVYLKTLQSQIHIVWEVLQEENKNILRKYEASKAPVPSLQFNEQQNKHTPEQSPKSSRYSQCSSLKPPIPTFQFEDETTSKIPNTPVSPVHKKRSDETFIVFQLSLNQVIIHRIIKEKESYQILPTDASKDHIPAVVGLSNGTWSYGKEALQKLDNVQGSERQFMWWIFELFLKTKEPQNDKIDFQETSYEVSVELLLGYLFHELKENVEIEENSQISRAWIIVPFWIPSNQRQQIVDAAKIAGLVNYRIINENSAGAYAFATSVVKSGGCDIVVLSENSGHMEVTLYEWISYNQHLKMHSHYNVENKTKKSPGILQRLLDWLSGYQEPGQSEDEFLKDVLKQLPRRNWQERAYLVMCENEKFKTTWNSRIRKRGDKLHMCDHTYAASGVNLLIQRNEPLGNIIHEQLTYSIMRGCVGEPPANICDKDKTNWLSETGRNFTLEIPVKKSEVNVFQTPPHYVGHIGELKVLNSQKNFQVLAKFTISNQGIVTLNEVNFKETGRLATTQTHTLSKKDWSWKTPNLNDTQLQVCMSFIDNLKQLKLEESKRHKIKRELAQKTEEMKTQILDGQGNFKSDLGRSMVVDQLTEIIELLNRPSIPSKDVEKQAQVVNNLSKKYL